MTHQNRVVNTFRSLFPKKAMFILTLKINPIKSQDRKQNYFFGAFLGITLIIRENPVIFI